MHLRGQLEPMPVGIFGALMSRDLFDALCKLPNSKAKEIQAAAQMVFDHPVASSKMKDEVRAILKEGR